MTTEEPGLPRITAENAAEYGPPSLNGFRTVSSRSREKAAPLFNWYWQMTGKLWDGQTHSFQLVRKKHWHMLPENKAKELQRLGGWTRDPTDRHSVTQYYGTRDRSNTVERDNELKRRRREAVEDIPRQLEQGSYRCPS